MAFHFMGQDLKQVALDGRIDDLDSLAYELLAAFFSLIEPSLQRKLASVYRGRMPSKKSRYQQLWEDAATKANGERDLTKLLQWNGKSSKRHVLKRIKENVKLAYFWKKACEAEQLDAFMGACADLLAHLDMANMPGEECTAVIRDGKRRAYVTGNGLWTSGQAIEASKTTEAIGRPLELDQPWFASFQACEEALSIVSVHLIRDYGLSQISLVNPIKGDTDGKFHAEMQLLDYMLDEGIVPERGYMGVSKPCCQYCGSRLQAAGIKYWNPHKIRGRDPNEQVKPPYSSYQDPLKVAGLKRAVQKLPDYGLILRIV